MNRRVHLATILLAAATGLPAQQPDRLTGALPGIDVLEQQQFAALKGRKLGLITNHTGITRDGRRSIDVLHGTDVCQLVCLFSPEHGIQGALDRNGIADGTDAATGLRIWSLYGDTKKPTAKMLAGVDTLVFDIQDIGCRFYTYASTMSLALEVAAEHHLAFVVLDRPNPLGGERYEGPVLPKDRIDFVGCHMLPVRHGMTLGELARMIVGERGLKVDLTVVPCQGWHRADYYEATLLRWVDPSPNMRNLTEAVLYPGIGLLEGTNLSVGRGTDTPFEVLGAPWCDGQKLAAWLLAQHIPGVAFVPVEFTPAASKYKGQKCGGIQISVTDRSALLPVRTGLYVACGLRALFGADWQTDKLDWLLKHEPALAALLDGAPPDRLEALWAKDLELFRMRRKPFLLYE